MKSQVEEVSANIIGSTYIIVPGIAQEYADHLSIIDANLETLCRCSVSSADAKCGMIMVVLGISPNSDVLLSFVHRQPAG